MLSSCIKTIIVSAKRLILIVVLGVAALNLNTGKNFNMMSIHNQSTELKLCLNYLIRLCHVNLYTLVIAFSVCI